MPFMLYDKRSSKDTIPVVPLQYSTHGSSLPESNNFVGVICGRNLSFDGPAPFRIREKQSILCVFLLQAYLLLSHPRIPLAVVVCLCHARKEPPGPQGRHETRTICALARGRTRIAIPSPPLLAVSYAVTQYIGDPFLRFCLRQADI